MTKLFNPEESWVPSGQVSIVSRAEVEKCIGPTTEHLQLLSGGQANTNIQVGRDKVLRLYRRDAGTAGKEITLLQKSWKSFLVPEVLSSGNGFVLTKYMNHSPIEDSAEQGAALGRALAEIHSYTYPTPGFLSPDLQIEESMENFVTDMWSYLCSFEENPKSGLSNGLLDEVLGFFDDKIEGLQEAAGQPVLLHGDFKVSNLYWTDQDKPLVFDWEFAYAGSALMDIGQLFRWSCSSEFSDGFSQAYGAAGGTLVEGWKRWAAVLDLINLVGLSHKSTSGSQKALDVTEKIRETIK